MTYAPSKYRGGQGFSHMSSMLVLKQILPLIQSPNQSSILNRKNFEAPVDTGSFVKPVKQCFIKNARLSPGTRICLMLLAGWAGQGTTIKTTTCTIAKQLNRSRRQVFRYLQDAMEEGYLLYSKSKDAMGYINGIKIWLNFGAINHSYDQYMHRKQSEYRTKQAVTHQADINCKLFIKKINDDEIETALSRIAQSLGLDYSFDKGYG